MSLPDSILEQVHEAISQAEADAASQVGAASHLPVDFDFDPPIAFSRSFAAGFSRERRGDTSPLTRAELLQYGAALGDAPNDPELLGFLYLVNAWGYGRTGYGRSRTGKVAESGFATAARQALELLRNPGDDLAPVSAYFLLNNAGHVKGWGPAFFTKFLMFADPVNTGVLEARRVPALVLDRLTAGQVNAYLSGEARERRPTRSRGLGRFRSSGWTTVQYAYYVALVRKLAEDKRFAGNPMKAERALFWTAQQQG